MAAREPPQPIGSASPARAISRGTVALAVFAAVLAVAGFSIARRCQLGFMGGLADEHFALGLKLRANGTLGPDRDEPSALRPPGYPAFVAAATAAIVRPPAQLSAAAFLDSGQRAVYAVQALALAATAALLFLWLSERLSPHWAASAALVFGLNPYGIVLVGLLHYAVLHLLLLVASAWTLQRALDRPAAGRALAAGVVAGVCNLVRPVTMMVPALVLAADVLARRPWRDTLRRTAALAAGMALALAPWAVRNWTVTGRLIPVGDTGWTALWGQTLRPLAVDPARYEWYELVAPHFRPLFARATGAPDYDYLVLVRRTADVERVFRAEALANLRQRPGVYLGNAVRTLSSYLLDVSPMFVETFAAVQDGCRGATAEVPSAWFHPGGRVFGRTALARIFRWTWLAVTGAAVLGLVLALRRRDRFALAPSLLLLAMGLTHALVLVSPMHYYSKLPLVVALAAYAGDVLAPPRRAAAAGALAVLATLALTGATLF